MAPIKLKHLLRPLIANALLREDASDDAHNLDLVSKGWGNWADKDGDVVAKTVNGTLAKIEPNTPTQPSAVGNKHANSPQQMSDAAESELGDLGVSSPIAKQSKLVDTLLSNDVASVAPDNYSRLGDGAANFNSAAHVEKANVMKAASNAINQGVNPDQDQATLAAFDAYSAAVEKEIGDYIGDSRHPDPESAPRRDGFRR